MPKAIVQKLKEPERLTYRRIPLWDVMKPGGRPYQPFPWQVRHLHRAIDAGFKRIALPCGRRSGKSESVQAEVVRAAVRPSEIVMGIEHFPIVYIVGPTSELAQRVWEPIWNMFVPDLNSDYIPPLGFLYQNHDKARGVIWLKNGAKLQRKTGDDPRSLQGERVTFAVVDEAQDMTDEAWENLIPALADSAGTLVAIGITRGKGRFRSLFQLGAQGEHQHYSASVPTSANPVMEVVALREGYASLDEYIDKVLGASLTENEKRQQYYAEWIDEDGAVFTHPENVFTLSDWESGPRRGHTYFMGVDLAKVHDYTVCYVGDVCCSKVVYEERFHGLDYTVQVPKIAKIARDWNTRILHIDATGSEGTVDFLREQLGGFCSLIPFKFTQESKANLISTLVRETERVNYAVPKAASVLLAEMQLYEGTVKGNSVKYSAPPGYYDDCVIALALLMHYMTAAKRMSKSPVQKPYVTFKTGGDMLQRRAEAERAAAVSVHDTREMLLDTALERLKAYEKA